MKNVGSPGKPVDYPPPPPPSGQNGCPPHCGGQDKIVSETKAVYLGGGSVKGLLLQGAVGINPNGGSLFRADAVFHSGVDPQFQPVALLQRRNLKNGIRRIK